MSIELVRATAAHTEILAQARIDFLKDYWGDVEPEIENQLRSELTQYFAEEIESKTYISWLAFDDEKLVSVGGMKIIRKPGSFRLPEGVTGYIMNMYTVPTHRKKGLATEILSNLQKDGREMGIRLFELHASEDGLPVYQKDGFKIHNEPTMRKFVME